MILSKSGGTLCKLNPRDSLPDPLVHGRWFGPFPPLLDFGTGQPNKVRLAQNIPLTRSPVPAQYGRKQSSYREVTFGS